MCLKYIPHPRICCVFRAALCFDRRVDAVAAVIDVFFFSGQPRGICSGSLSRGWGICATLGDPREFDTCDKNLGGRAVKLRVLFLRDGGFHGKRYGFCVTVTCPRRTRQVEILRGEFLI